MVGGKIMSELCQPQREKYWDELDDKQKIEKLAWTVEYLHRMLNHVGEGLQKQENHVHVEGRIFYGDGPVNPYTWPNTNPLNRESPDRLRGLLQ
jgi:hypothetical protein